MLFPFSGQFELELPGKPKVILPNTLVGTGAQAYLKKLFQNADVLPANLYLGVTTANYSYATTLADVELAEPVGNGYARQPLARSAVGWDVSYINGAYRAKSSICVFTATSDWDKPWRNIFLCTVASGAGLLLAISGKYAAEIKTKAGAAPSLAYEFWARGLSSEQ